MDERGSSGAPGWDALRKAIPPDTTGDPPETGAPRPGLGKQELDALLGVAASRPLDDERAEAILTTGEPDDDLAWDDELDGAPAGAPSAPEEGVEGTPSACVDPAKVGADGKKKRGTKKKTAVEAALEAITAQRAGALDTPPAPVAFAPPEVKPYPADPDDVLFPEPGFVSDFCYSCKGKESPVIFNIFAALFAVAVVSTRKAQFRWAAGSFFPNLYVLFCAPPASCTKSFAPNRAHELIQAVPKVLLERGDLVLSKEKTVDFITSSASPGGIMQLMAPRDEAFRVEGGGMHIEHFGSQAYVWADEFVTFLSDQRYAEGLTDALTKWYDCRDSDRETFKHESAEPLKDIYFNLAGALTPIHLQRSIPERAFAGGFMSRVVVVTQQRPANLFPLPEDYPGFPTVGDLAERLAWVAYNARGEYDFTQEAREFYKEFYVKTKLAYFEAGTDTQNYARARHVQLVIRLAMLLRMAEYRPGTDVTLSNVLKAIELLEFTTSASTTTLDGVGATVLKKNYTRMREYIAKQGSVTRGKLLKRMSKAGCLAAETDALLEQLAQEGSLEMLLDGHVKSSGMHPSTMQGEVYRWVEMAQKDGE